MNPFRIHTGLTVPLDRSNVDTDQIIPKQFLKRVERTGFGEFLFYDWRVLADGQPDLSFPLNESRYREASILIAGKNFGVVTDIVTGPDGGLYVTSLSNGTVYKIR